MSALTRFGSRLTEVLKRSASLPENPPDDLAEDGFLHQEGERWWVRRDGHWVLHEPTEEEKADYLITLTALHTKLQMSTAELLRKKFSRRLHTYRQTSRDSHWNVHVEVGNDFGLRLGIHEIKLDIECQAFMTDEALAKATVSSEAFEEFLAVSVRQLHALVYGQDEEILEEAERYERLAAVGLQFRVPVMTAETFQGKLSETEAIESIMSDFRPGESVLKPLRQPHQG